MNAEGAMPPLQDLRENIIQGVEDTGERFGEVGRALREKLKNKGSALAYTAEEIGKRINQHKGETAAAAYTIALAMVAAFGEQDKPSVKTAAVQELAKNANAAQVINTTDSLTDEQQRAVSQIPAGSISYTNVGEMATTQQAQKVQVESSTAAATQVATLEGINSAPKGRLPEKLKTGLLYKKPELAPKPQPIEKILQEGKYFFYKIMPGDTIHKIALMLGLPYHHLYGPDGSPTELAGEFEEALYDLIVKYAETHDDGKGFGEEFFAKQQRVFESWGMDTMKTEMSRESKQKITESLLGTNSIDVEGMTKAEAISQALRYLPAGAEIPVIYIDTFFEMQSEEQALKSSGVGGLPLRETLKKILDEKPEINKADMRDLKAN